MADFVYFAASDSYDICINTGIHAHPDSSKWIPKRAFDTIVLLKKGGYAEYCFKVEQVIKAEPEKILKSRKNIFEGILTDKEYGRLYQYVDTRHKKWIFGQGTDFKYVFYILKSEGKFKEAFRKPYVRNFIYGDTSDIEKLIK